jgi:hypothetical protein
MLCYITHTYCARTYGADKPAAPLIAVLPVISRDVAPNIASFHVLTGTFSLTLTEITRSGKLPVALCLSERVCRLFAVRGKTERVVFLAAVLPFVAFVVA